MAQTTNYNFEIPDDTDLVKDGALAMRDLGQDVDTQLFTALGGDYPGLRLVKKQTIGTGVSTVTVSDAFSATYDNYKIILSGGSGSSNTDMALRIGGVTTGYYRQYIFTAWNNTVSGEGVAGSADRITYAASTSANGLHANLDIFSPFLSKNTTVTALGTGSSAGYIGTVNGLLFNTDSYTSFTFIPSAGTLTGGTIYVYGYGTS